MSFALTTENTELFCVKNEMWNIERGADDISVVSNQVSSLLPEITLFLAFLNDIVDRITHIGHSLYVKFWLGLHHGL